MWTHLVRRYMQGSDGTWQLSLGFLPTQRLSEMTTWLKKVAEKLKTMKTTGFFAVLGWTFSTFRVSVARMRRRPWSLEARRPWLVGFEAGSHVAFFFSPQVGAKSPDAKTTAGQNRGLGWFSCSLKYGCSLKCGVFSRSSSCFGGFNGFYHCDFQQNSVDEFSHRLHEGDADAVRRWWIVGWSVPDGFAAATLQEARETSEAQILPKNYIWCPSELKQASFSHLRAKSFSKGIK